MPLPASFFQHPHSLCYPPTQSKYDCDSAHRNRGMHVRHHQFAYENVELLCDLYNSDLLGDMKGMLYIHHINISLSQSSMLVVCSIDFVGFIRKKKKTVTLW